MWADQDEYLNEGDVYDGLYKLQQGEFLFQGSGIRVLSIISAGGVGGRITDRQTRRSRPHSANFDCLPLSPKTNMLTDKHSILIHSKQTLHSPKHIWENLDSKVKGEAQNRHKSLEKAG